MYSDNTLTPKETVRLCALGTLANEPLSYVDLANAIRHFIDRVQGPSIDVLGSSVELLKYEGLIVTSNIEKDIEILNLTKKGRTELRELLTADMRANDSSYNKLIEALKFRFLHLLTFSEKIHQAGILIDRIELEKIRLIDLRKYHEGDTGYIISWLDQDIQQLTKRLVWLKKFKQTL